MPLLQEVQSSLDYYVTADEPGQTCLARTVAGNALAAIAIVVEGRTNRQAVASRAVREEKLATRTARTRSVCAAGAACAGRIAVYAGVVTSIGVLS